MSLDPTKMDADHIKKVQRVLNDKLGSNVQITGEFDTLTTVALSRFQRSMNIPITGEYDDATQAYIEPTLSRTTAKDAPNPITIPTSSEGNAVITLDQFRQMVGTDSTTAQKWYQPMLNAMTECGITNNLDICAFLAQIGHETAGLKVLSENLNYDSYGLADTWPNRYAEYGPDKKPIRVVTSTGVDGRQIIRNKPNALAIKLNRNPQAIANNVYANRLGNGDEASGDGWNHRGMGPIQLTGLTNQETMGKKLGVDLKNNPELLMQPDIGSRASAHFWLDNGVSAYAVKGDFDGVSDKVNLGRKTEKIGDAIGYTDRLNRFNANRKLLGI